MNANAFSGKVVIITGASSGIGCGTAVHFAKLGAKLVITGRNEQRLTATKDECIKAGGKAENVVYVVGEITDSNLRKSLIETAVEKFGGVHVLVNNAGLAIPGLLCGENSTLDNYDSIFDVNIKAVIELCRLASVHLIKTKGNIINVSAIASMHPMANLTYYCMSKSALDTLTKCLAQELASKGVRVNSVNPAGVDTPMVPACFKSGGSEPTKEQVTALLNALHPIGRGGTTEDIASSIAFLASDKASWITGTIMKVDGGFSIKPHNVFPAD